MFKPLLRLTFIGLIWKNYKRIIVSTVFLFAFFWFVGYAHDQFLHFASQAQPPLATGASFFIKWCALLFAICIYMLFHSNFFKPKKSPRNPSQANQSNPLDSTDPFDVIRKKRKLRSQAEILVEKNGQKEQSKNKSNRN